MAYIWDAFANTFLFILPFAILPITLSIWLWLSARSKKALNVQASNIGPKPKVINGIKLGLILSLVLFCLGIVYLASQFRSG